MEEWAIVWAVAAALFVIIEVVSVAFVSIYFAVGALAAMGVALAGGSIPWQFGAFAATGVVLMALTRPFLKKKLESPDIPTNVNLIVGKGGIVTIPIDNDASTGQIRVGTEYWTARMVDAHASTVVPTDAHVVVESVQGVTARVRPRDVEPSA